MLKLFEFLFWCTVLMKWELFPRHYYPGIVDWEHIVEKTYCVPPTLMRTVCFVRQKEWLESFCFIFLFSFCSWSFFLFLAVGWPFKQLEANTKYSFMPDILYNIFSPELLFPESSHCWWSFCTFVTLCICVNVPVSLESTIFMTPKL